MYSYGIAQMLGIFFIIMGIGCIVNHAYMGKALNAILKNQTLQVIVSTILLIIGIYFIVSHNFWGFNRGVIVTIIGWFIFLTGACGIIFPAIWVKRTKIFLHKIPLKKTGIIMLIAGIILAFFGNSILTFF